MKNRIEKIDKIICLNDDMSIKKEIIVNKFAINISDYTKNLNYEGKEGYLYLLISNNYQMELDIMFFEKKNVRIEKDTEIMHSSIPIDYQGLLSCFLATERFTKDATIKYTKEDVLNYFKKIKSIFKLDIERYHNVMKPYPYKLSIYYNWRKMEEKVMEIKFNLRDNFRDSLLINIKDYQITYLKSMHEWHKFIGMKKDILEFDKQFISHDNKLLLNLPFNQHIKEPYSSYLKKFYKNKSIPIDSKHRSNVTITYKLDFT